MIASSFSMIVGAEETAAVEYEYNTTGIQTLDYYTGKVHTFNDKGALVTDDNGKAVFATDGAGEAIVVDTAAERLEKMDLRVEKDGFRLYVDAYSGEVAVENIATGEALFTNPFNVSISKATASIKAQLLSQISVKYTDATTGAENTYYSFDQAAERGQIKVKNIKGGIRVEYSIGREQSKLLVPEMIEESDFNTLIMGPLAEALGKDAYDYKKFEAFYVRMDKSDYVGEALEAVLKKYPMMNRMVYYRLDEKASEIDKIRLEQYVKTYIPDFTFEDLEDVHMKTEYQAEDSNPPLFKLALEYTLDEDGVNVRLPANGLRYNESLYRVTSLDILPYMGAASSEGEGYNFFPDGSGAIFDFDKIQELGTTTTITGKVYGQDYAYHTITGTHQEIIRYPVYGIVGSNVITIDEEAEEGTEGEITEGEETEEGNDAVDTMSYTEGEDNEPSADAPIILISPNPNAASTTTPVDVERQSGFVAIITEGDAMMEISSYHETQAHEYNTVQVTVYPRPQDSYDLSDAISAGAGGELTVVSSRKYTGSYRIKYILLTPDEVAAEKGIKDYYECSYVGMAYAYRDYLVGNGTLTKLTEEDVKDDIPLYIETFGTMETVEKILSVPVTVLTPLTTFEDIRTMYDDLAEEGITNINFKLTGFANGGMVSTVPYKLKWEKSVGGNKGFEELLEYAKEQGFGIYPDFDFVYIETTGSFDGLRMKKHAVKTIDNRYTSRREYSGTKQAQISYYEIAISPAYFSHFYEKFTDNYNKYDPIGISVSTLGSDLNSDFDKKEPYNREDSKQYTMNAFEYLDNNYASVMTSSANAYTWKYVDHITDIALDSSRYAQAAAAVPFLGIVLHGYVQIAGEPINLEGNTSYALLKSIESGAGLNFLLSYRNTDNLKEDEILSKHYSVRYDIWFDDVVDLYNQLNIALRDVQTSVIVDHHFMDGIRVPDADELEADARAEMEAIVRAEAEKLVAAEEAARLTLVNSRISIQKAYAEHAAMLAAVESTLKSLMYDNYGVSYLETVKKNASDYEAALEALETLTAELEELQNAELPEAEEEQAAHAEAIAAKQAEVDAKQKAVSNAIANIQLCYYNMTVFATTAVEAYDTFASAITSASEGYDHLVAEKALSEDILAELHKMLEEAEATYALVDGKREEIFAYTEALYEAVKNYIDAVPYEYVANNDGATDGSDADAEKTTVPAKYQSDDNMISYVEYENGISFLLNFNNYTVKVELDGTVYTIDEYGYVMFDGRN